MGWDRAGAGGEKRRGRWIGVGKVGWGEDYALVGVWFLCVGDCGRVTVSVMNSIVSSMVSGLFVAGFNLIVRLLEYGGGGFGMMLYVGNSVLM